MAGGSHDEMSDKKSSDSKEFRSSKSDSNESLTKVQQTTNKYIKVILVITTIGFITCLTLTNISGLISENIMTFHFGEDYFPFQTNFVTFLLIDIIKICNL
jgi:hypothetical protein